MFLIHFLPLLADTLTQPSEIFVIVGVVLGSGIIGLILRGVKKWMTAETADKGGLQEAQAILAEHGKDLKEIKKQITPNGKNTKQLGDSVARMEDTQEEIKEKQDKMWGKLEIFFDEWKDLKTQMNQMNNELQQHLGEHQQKDKS